MIYTYKVVLRFCLTLQTSFQEGQTDFDCYLFTDEDAKAQRGHMTFLLLHSCDWKN